jgi:hypothetical protein
LFLFFYQQDFLWSHKEQEKGLIYFSFLFLCTGIVGSGMKTFGIWIRDPEWKKLGIRIRDKTSAVLQYKFNFYFNSFLQ